MDNVYSLLYSMNGVYSLAFSMDDVYSLAYSMDKKCLFFWILFRNLFSIIVCKQRRHSIVSKECIPYLPWLSQSTIKSSPIRTYKREVVKYVQRWNIVYEVNSSCTVWNVSERILEINKPMQILLHFIKNVS